MATYIKVLHDNDGNQIAPVTLEEAIHDEDGVGLSEKLDAISAAALPAHSSSDSGKFLRVNSSGAAVWETVDTWSGGDY